MQKIACFVTPHGFGHATRTIAVVEALQRIIPDLHPHFFTTVPQSLFAETLKDFSYHPFSCDIGLVQKNGLQADLPATIKSLDSFLPFDEKLICDLAEQIEGCCLVLCDIAPLGIAVADKAEIPSVLIENFTWDWIYRAYLDDYPELQHTITYLSRQYRKAGVHIRCQPYCGSTVGDFECGPIFRTIRSTRTEMRKRLSCTNRRTVLISMGGIDLQLPFIKQLPAIKDTFFILTGQNKTKRCGKNILLLGRDSPYYHPDLINASDLVVCKSGYSTITECVQAGVPIVTVGRTSFPETGLTLLINSYISQKKQQLQQQTVPISLQSFCAAHSPSKPADPTCYGERVTTFHSQLSSDRDSLYLGLNNTVVTTILLSHAKHSYNI